MRDVHLRTCDEHGRSREIVQLSLHDLGDGISPYPFALAYPQDDHERFLAARLAEIGTQVEWDTKLERFTQSGGDGVCAAIAGPSGSSEVRASYLCGCDGAHSTVRQQLGVGFAGATYEQLFFVCDCRVSSPFTTDLVVTLGERALVLLFPIRSTGMQRLIGLIPPGVADPQHATFDAIRPGVEALLGTQVVEVNWFSTYRVHHRVAERFRVDRAFILGDAARIHSPAGGQGMNTGIGDAVNLGWKLADVLRGRAAGRCGSRQFRRRAHRLCTTTRRDDRSRLHRRRARRRGGDVHPRVPDAVDACACDAPEVRSARILSHGISNRDPLSRLHAERRSSRAHSRRQSLKSLQKQQTDN